MFHELCSTKFKQYRGILQRPHEASVIGGAHEEEQGHKKKR